MFNCSIEAKKKIIDCFYSLCDGLEIYNISKSDDKMSFDYSGKNNVPTTQFEDICSQFPKDHIRFTYCSIDEYGLVGRFENDNGKVKVLYDSYNYAYPNVDGWSGDFPFYETCLVSEAQMKEYEKAIDELNRLF